MITTKISLPDRPHFRLVDIAQAIANQTPSKPDNATGIDCINRKLMPPFRLDSDPMYLFRVKGFVGELPLSEFDRETLRAMLIELPTISHFMSTEEIEHFFEQYYKLPGRPSWEPKITSPGDRQWMQEDYEKRVARHCEDFLSMAKEGAVRLLNENLSILTGTELTIGYAQHVAIATKEDGIKFCKLLGIELIIEGSNIVSDQSIQDMTMPAEVDKKSPKTQTSKKPRSKERKDVITHLIDKEIENNGGNFEFKPIWTSFVKMARDEEHPFIKYSFEDRCPVFLRANKEENLTEKKLQVRLGRLKSKVLAKKFDVSVNPIQLE